MQRLIALGLAVLLGLSAPALAQTAGGSNANQSSTNASTQSGSGLDALAQAPGGGPGFFGGASPLLVGGGLALGVGVLIAVIAQQNKSDTPVSP